jgi:hypothetical protein
MTYLKLKQEATHIKSTVSLLDYFFRLDKKGIILFDGKHGKEYFFRFEHQKTGSISVNDQKNIWFDHSNEDGGDIIKAVQLFEKKSFVDAVKYLSEEKINGICTHTSYISNPSNVIKYEIDYIHNSVKHPALLKYINNRGIGEFAIDTFIKEIHWRYGDKRYFGIGLVNIQGGYAVRNSLFKGNIGKSDISVLTIGKDPKSVKLFEGLMDFLSYRTLKEEETYIGVVLNSTANLTNHTIEYIASIASSTPIHLYLDNDKGGYDATKKILNMIPNAQDKSNLYVTKNGSDINDFLIEQKSKKSNN